MKRHFWIGRFSSENNFRKYYSPTGYLEKFAQGCSAKKDWAPFSAEIGYNIIDEDYLWVAYNSTDNYKVLLSKIPVKHKLFLEACTNKGIVIEEMNAMVSYPVSEMDNVMPDNAKEMIYVGAFNESALTILVSDDSSRFGTFDVCFFGMSRHTKLDFQKYLDQDQYMAQLEAFKNGEAKKPTQKYSCQFCNDVEIPFYRPESLKLYYLDIPQRADLFFKSIIPDSSLADTTARRILEEESYKYHKECYKLSSREKDEIYEKNKINVVIHVLLHDDLSAKVEPKIKVFPREFIGKYSDKGFVPQKDEYLGLKYYCKCGNR